MASARRTLSQHEVPERDLDGAEIRRYRLSANIRRRGSAASHVWTAWLAVIDENEKWEVAVDGPRIHSIEAIAVDIPLTRNFGGS